MIDNKQIVIVDSSGLVALVKSDDALHKDAIKAIKRIEAENWQTILPFEVLTETLNVIGKIIGKKDSIKVGNSILEQYNAHMLSFVQSEPHIIAKTITKLEATTGSPSFTDCLVMTQADEQNTPFIFGFDATFSKNGYKFPA